MDSSITNLPQFGFLAVTGKDATSFLQGYTTCDVDKLDETHSLGAICNLQGRMLTNFRIAETNDGLILRMNRGLVQTTKDFLAKYIVFSKATLVDVSDQWHCYGITGSRPAAEAGQILLSVDDDRFEIWCQSELQSTSDATQWDVMECRQGLAWLEQATAEQYLPQMFDLHALNAIDFDKGCYLGQEIVARAQYRGELKRRLHRGHTETELTVGMQLFNDDERGIGEIVAAAGDAALAVLKISADETSSVKAKTAQGDALQFSPVS
jgi:tRNA-modifying protein YgfZ